MTSTDKERCFALLGKLTSCNLNEEERFDRLLQIFSYNQKLEGLCRSTDSKKKPRSAQNAGENAAHTGSTTRSLQIMILHSRSL